MVTAIDRFTARSLTESIRKFGNARANLLLQRYFRQRNTHLTKEINYGKLTVLPRKVKWRRPGQEAIPVGKNTGSARAFTIPSIRLKKVMDEEFFTLLDPAYASYVGTFTDPNAQIDEKLNTELTALRYDIDLTMEAMCAELLGTGIITFAFGDGQSASFDVGFAGGSGADANIQPDLTGTSCWDKDGSSPLRTVNALANQIRTYSTYRGPLDVICGMNVVDELNENKKFQALLDNRNINAGSLTIAEQGSSMGTAAGFNWLKYACGFHDDNDAFVEVWDPDTIAVVPASSPQSYSIEFGDVFDKLTPDSMPKHIPTEYFSKMIDKEDPVVVELIAESNPLPVIKDATPIRVQKVLSAAVVSE